MLTEQTATPQDLDIKGAALLHLFKEFLKNLEDVEEEDADWQNRLGWAWYRLSDFAELLGPEYLAAVQYFYPEE